MIRFLDLHKINARFEMQFKNEFKAFLNSGQYILGDGLKHFENNFANYCGVKYCIGTGNGLDALTLIFKGLVELGRLKEHDEVLVPANTYIASILSIIHAGLKPVLVEPNELTFNISTEDLKIKISSKTKAILVVHLYGQLADIDSISTMANENNLMVIEDAAQAHGARDINGKKAGSFGLAAAFSFYPTKNLGALGDGGAITTDSKPLADIVYKLRNYGTSSKYINDYTGVNSRLDELQAKFLDIKLKFLDRDNEQRRQIALQYLSEINTPKLVLPFYDNSKNHVFYSFVLRLEERDRFIQYLSSKGIETLIHYPKAPHRQKALSTYCKLNLPITEKIHETVVSLPLNPILSMKEIKYIIDTINLY